MQETYLKQSDSKKLKIKAWSKFHQANANKLWFTILNLADHLFQARTHPWSLLLWSAKCLKLVSADTSYLMTSQQH